MTARLLLQGYNTLPHYTLHAKGVFFHADDMGATSSITARICDSWDEGILDSFSILGNCGHPGMIAARLQAYPDRPARIAAHLNLAEGKPLTPGNQVTRLVDQFGCFKTRFFELVTREYPGKTALERAAFLSEVEREWRAQIENVIEIIGNRPLAALDGHIHMHMVPFLFRLAVELAKEYGIPEIRIVREPFYLSRDINECLSKRFLINCVKRDVLSSFSKNNAQFAENAGLRSPDRMLGVLYSGMMSRANIITGVAAARRQGAKWTEVLVHIGRAIESELDWWSGNKKLASFALSAARDSEYEELKKMRVRRSAEWREPRAS